MIAAVLSSVGFRSPRNSSIFISAVPTRPSVSPMRCPERRGSQRGARPDCFTGREWNAR